MTLTAKDLFGAYTAIITPFSADGSTIDFASYGKLVEEQISAGISGIVVAGSTGEAATLSDDEYRKLVTTSAEIVKKRVRLIAGIGTNNTARGREMATWLTNSGMDGILVVAPPYNKPPQDGILAHFREIAKSTSLPLIAYNIPGRSAVNIAATTLGKLADEGTIIGVKESSANMDQFMDIAALCAKKAALLSGEDSLVHAIMACGGKGVISASANLIPELFVRMTSLALKGDYAGALGAQLEALPIVRAMFIETNPIPVKTALALRGTISSPTVRLPLVPASPETVAKLRALPGLAR
jgi:4-hydroxy-tetrahydrodipicolinate synthase